MQTTFKLFISCLFCLALTLMSGCGKQDSSSESTSTSTIAEQAKVDKAETISASTATEQTNVDKTGAVSTLTPDEQAECDKLIAEIKTNALVEYLSGKTGTGLYFDDVLRIAKRLVDLGADVNAKNKFGCTPLHHAARDGECDELVKFLIDKGADVNAKAPIMGVNSRVRNFDVTPLFYSLYYHSGNELAKILVSNGADVNAKLIPDDVVSQGSENWGEMAGATALHWAARTSAEVVAELAAETSKPKPDINPGYVGNLEFGKRFASEFAQLLVSKGADVNAKARNGKTPLDYAKAKTGNTDMIKYLESVGAKSGTSDR
jgi:ankyrin repeat protein